MSDAWRSYPGAPPHGTVLGHLDKLMARSCTAIDIDGFSILLVRGPFGLRAFVNACPHQYLPLDRHADDILSSDGQSLICSNHDARFDADSGMAQQGPVQGCWLDPVPVVIGPEGVISINSLE